LHQCAHGARPLREPRHAVNHVHYQVEAIEIVEHHHVERRGGGPFLVFDLVQYASAPGIDPHSVITRYHSKAIPTSADCSGQNFTRFKSADADRAIDAAGSSLDPDKRRAAYALALGLVNSAYVIIWLYDRFDIDARSAALRGWQPNTWQRFTWNTEDWWMKA